MADSTEMDLFAQRIAEALPSANIPTLLLLLHQFTGEDCWLKPPFTPVKSGWDENDSGGLAVELQTEIRNAALTAIMSWRQGAHIVKPDLSANELIRMLSVSEAEPIPPEYAGMMIHKLRRYSGTVPDPVCLPEDFRVLIIGAGMSGIAAAIRLRQLGVAYIQIEKQDRTGGVWHSHHYPGCGVDTPGHLYSYTFAGGDWSKFFPLQEEINDYFDRVAREFGIESFIRYGTECLLTRYDEDTRTWHSRLRRPDGTEETLVTNVVISAVGGFTTPKWPSIPGLPDFDGPVVHTSKWDPDVALDGKRVAVIGNGASAMQVVPAIADRVGALTIFQRSRQWAAPFPKFRMPVPEPVRFLFREVPHYEWLYRLRLSWIYDSQVHESLQKDPAWPHPDRSVNAVNDSNRETYTRYMEQQLAGRPDLLAKVIPPYPPFGKRMLLDNGWYKTLLKPHVKLVDGAAALVEVKSIHGINGDTYETDVLIVASGYDITRFLLPVQVIGRNGVTIREAWNDDDCQAYLGSVVPGFPNFFMLYGPNTALGHRGNFIFTIENQIDYVLSVLRKMGKKKLAEVECRQDVYRGYNQTIQEMHQKMIWSHPGMSTYFRNDRGRIVTNSPWRLIDYWKLTREADLGDYCTVARVDSQTEASAEDIASTSSEAGEGRRSGDELVGGRVQNSSQTVECDDACSGAK
ncbi:FAD dependent pyridine nucleotide-disulfide oxidoreductase protein (plasmid) [Rhizobium etli bv. mimosae str. IE4771]|uniref:FAD dependent pyridine nucleotide-disulfide oxidoreductase protein n=1 Tax=Rhizobium etli bv. mimosae str. IE4771 TaxID=1432050 RepID=A0A060IDS0_RHIET|nr:NAD(P)/FAD-dependent oxidoreductase [Rhizobium sp. IE4771]AIC29866.1 FAD dependent pyridine nucleotide-disulfide oxidoreductase protein [Rhizobium sp. IE4771]